MRPLEPITPSSLPPTAPPQRRRWLDRCLTAAMLTCFALGGWFWSQQPATHAAIQSPAKPIAPRKHDEVQPREKLVTRSIEDVQLGQRLVGKNPLRHETSLPSNIHPEGWRTVRLTMMQHGVQHDLALLRSLDWLSDTGAAEGQTIDLELPEMGLSGPALVKSISSCPPLEADDGAGRMLVTGTMSHFADNVLDLEITGLDEPLGVTTTHPIWSEDRRDFIPASRLRAGERLQSAAGVLTQVTRITPRRGPPEVVYNLEVDAEHVYRVAEAGLLVHNACVDWVSSGTNAMNEAHIFSSKHLNSGIMQLGGSRKEIMTNAGKIIGEVNDAGLLKQGSNQIETLMNGQRATIRAFFDQAGELKSVNIFSGSSGRQLGNVIPW